MNKYAFIFVLSFIFFIQELFSQSDTVHLDEVVIHSSPNATIFKQTSRAITLITHTALENTPATDIGMVLEQLAGIDLRQRGTFGMQADINIRGGSFDQNLILINGIAVNDPQSGHLNMDIALSLDDINQIELIEGPASRWFGTNALSGGINIITKQENHPALNLNFSGGQYGYIQTRAAASYQTGQINQHTSFQFSGSDGYERDTDFKDRNFNHTAHYSNKNTVSNFQLSYRDKAFGAHNFYTTKYPDQFEQTRTLFTSLAFKTGNKIRYSGNISWRRHYDRFELFREGADWYQRRNKWYVMGNDSAGFRTPSGFYPYSGPNYHRTDVFTLHTGSRFKSKIGKISLRFSYRYEKIISNVLGEPMTDTIFSRMDKGGYYNHTKSRDNFNFFFNHLYTHGRFTLSMGFHAFYNTEYGFLVNPGVDLSYFLNSKFKVFLSFNRANRLPTFTDLYYQGPSHISNPNLKPENIRETEIGYKYYSKNIMVSLSFFYRMTDHLIDWVRANPQDKWESKNLTGVNTKGIAASISYQNRFYPKNWFQSIQINYTYLSNNKNSYDFLSLYALDYLKHQLGINMNQRLSRRLYLGWNLLFQKRNGSYFDSKINTELAYPKVFLLNAKITYKKPVYQLFIQATNILNQHYHDIGSVVMPGTWVIGGIRIHLPTNKVTGKKN